MAERKSVSRANADGTLGPKERKPMSDATRAKWGAGLAGAGALVAGLTAKKGERGKAVLGSLKSGLAGGLGAAALEKEGMLPGSKERKSAREKAKKAGTVSPNNPEDFTYAPMPESSHAYSGDVEKTLEAVDRAGGGRTKRMSTMWDDLGGSPA